MSILYNWHKKRGRKAVKKAFDKLVYNFPNSRFKMYWEPITDEFFIMTSDFETARTDEYRRLVHKLYEEMHNKTYFRVIITGSSNLENEEELEENYIPPAERVRV